MNFIGRSVASLRQQSSTHALHIFVVDDNSSDGTAQTLRCAVTDSTHGARVRVISGRPLPPGWSGKLWAVQQGIEQASQLNPEFFLLTDADIEHAPDNIARLAAIANEGGYDLLSFMVKLHCRSLAEKLLIPAFVFFFLLLYPPRWIRDPRRKTAGAAGGCMLIRPEALNRAGGIAAIRHEIIDDCALGRRMKTQGPIWLGLTERATSLRPYETVEAIGRMVSRSAYAQLGYSIWVLIGVLAGMILTYVAPPVAAVIGTGWMRACGAAAWTLMAVSFLPMARFYRVSPLWGVALPLIGATYTLFTLQSAIQVWRGQGGMWKGRAQAKAGGA